MVEHETARALLRAAYTSRPADVDTAAALAPEELDPRMMLQLGGFTVHGSRTPLEQLEGAVPHLKKVVISSEAKLDIIGWLDRLGIQCRNLFPDLQNLSKEIREYGFLPDPLEEEEDS